MRTALLDFKVFEGLPSWFNEKARAWLAPEDFAIALALMQIPYASVPGLKDDGFLNFELFGGEYEALGFELLTIRLTAILLQVLKRHLLCSMNTVSGWQHN